MASVPARQEHATVGRAPSPGSARRARPSFRIALAAASTLFTLGLCECGYRGWLWYELIAQEGQMYCIYSRPVAEFDAEFGYHYRPDTRSQFLYVRNGQPVEAGEVDVNRLGNIGTAALSDDWDSAALKVLVVGDSFTAFQLPQASWCEYLPELLEASASGRVALLNYGRDGYGMLQMVHMAAAQARQYRPDLILVAFIGDDLHRGRFWRTVVDGGTGQRLLVTTEPVPQPDPQRASEACLIDARVSAEWCERLVAGHETNDPLFQSASRTLAQRRREQHPFYACFFRTSFLANKLRWGDPYRDLYRPTRNPRFPGWSLAEDAQFRDDIEFLNRYEGRVLFMHLPMLPEMQSGNYQLDPQDESLLASLRETCRRPIVSLLECRSQLTSEIESHFLRPDGTHPSPIGARFYAGEIAARVLASDRY